MNHFDRLLTATPPIAVLFTDDIDSTWSRIREWSDGFDPLLRRLLACRWDAIPLVDRLIDDVIMAFADIALADWPYWYGQVLNAADLPTDFERSLDLLITLPRVERERLHVLPMWLRMAANRCLHHESPFDSSLAREV